MDDRFLLVVIPSGSCEEIHLPRAGQHWD